MSTKACLANSAKRLRYLLNHPVEPYRKSYTEAERLAASFAYEYALKVLIDEFGERENYCAFMYGNDPAYLTSWPSTIGN